MKSNSRLRKEAYINCSGLLLKSNSIKALREVNYIIRHGHQLDGDAPKSFIKAYFYSKGGQIRKSNPKTWDYDIAKTAEKWYPHESVIEFMINRIGEVLGIHMNEIRLVFANGQIRFLSKFFRRRDEVLIHGAEICGQYLEDEKFAVEIAEDRNTARELFTFEFIEEAMKSVFPLNYQILLDNLVKMLVFDAITGNNDRHFYNWGVLDSPFMVSKMPKFAPVYDSARGLLWNWKDEDISRQWNLIEKGGRKIEKYIQEASPRVSFENNATANHFELIQFLKKTSENYLGIVQALSTQEMEERTMDMLKSEFFSYFIKERQLATEYILRRRFQIIRGELL